VIFINPSSKCVSGSHFGFNFQYSSVCGPYATWSCHLANVNEIK